MKGRPWIVVLIASFVAIASCSNTSDEAQPSNGAPAIRGEVSATIDDRGVAPVLAASEDRVLAVGVVIMNQPPGGVPPNEAVLVSSSGRAVPLPPLPGPDPLVGVAATAIAANAFVVVGIPCGQVEVGEDADCASDREPTRALLLEDETWTEVAAPPASIRVGVQGLGSTGGPARFATGSGTIITYESGRDRWTEAPSPFASVEATCRTDDGLVVVGRRAADGDGGTGGFQGELVLGRLVGNDVGTLVPVARVESSAQVVCDPDGSTLALLSATGLGPSVAVDADTLVATELPELPRVTSLDSPLFLTAHATIRDGDIEVTMATSQSSSDLERELVTYRWSREDPATWLEIRRAPTGPAGPGRGSTVVASFGVVMAVPTEGEDGGGDHYVIELLTE